RLLKGPGGLTDVTAPVDVPGARQLDRLGREEGTTNVERGAADINRGPSGSGLPDPSVIAGKVDVAPQTEEEKLAIQQYREQARRDTGTAGGGTPSQGAPDPAREADPYSGGYDEEAGNVQTPEAMSTPQPAIRPQVRQPGAVSESSDLYEYVSGWG